MFEGCQYRADTQVVFLEVAVIFPSKTCSWINIRLLSKNTDLTQSIPLTLTLPIIYS